MFIFNKIISAAKSILKNILTMNSFLLPVLFKDIIKPEPDADKLIIKRTYQTYSTAINELDSDNKLIVNISVISSDIYLNRPRAFSVEEFKYEIEVLSCIVKNAIVRTYKTENINYEISVESSIVKNCLITNSPVEKINYSIEILESVVI